MPSSGHSTESLAGTLRKASAGGTTALTMERSGATVMFKNVLGDVCDVCSDVCGKGYIHEDVSAAVYEKAEDAVLGLVIPLAIATSGGFASSPVLRRCG